MKNKSDYLETHYEIVKHLVLNEDLFMDKIDGSTQQCKGTGGMWVLAERITDSFQEKYEDSLWANEDYYETLWKFIDDYKI